MSNPPPASTAPAAPPATPAAPATQGPTRKRRWARRLDPRWWTTGTKIAVVLVLAALVPMVAVAWVSLRTGRESVERSQLASVEATAQFSAAAVGELLTGTTAQADQLATQPEVVAALLDPVSAPLDDAILSGMLVTSPDLAGVFVVDRTGSVVSAAPESAGEEARFQSQRWFSQALSGSPATSDVIEGTRPGTLSMFVAVPARPVGSAAVGVVALELRAEAVLWALNRAPQSPGSQVLLANLETVVVGARDHRLRYQALGEMALSTAAQLAETRHYPVASVVPLELDGFETTMPEQAGTITSTELPGRGDQTIAYHQVDARDLWVVVAEPRSTFLAPIEQLADQTIAAGILVGLIATLGSIVIARSISRPVRALTEAAGAVERDEGFDEERLGRYTHGHGDIARLSRVMQRMVREVTERERRLREQVKQLKVEIDQERRAKEVTEVVESDFFKDIEARAAEMRQRAKGGEA